MLLDMTLRDLERILYFEQYMVIEPRPDAAQAARAAVARRSTCERQEEYGDDGFSAGIGAEADPRACCKAIDLDRGAPTQLRERDARDQFRGQAQEARQAPEDGRGASSSRGNQPEWMILRSCRSSRRSCARWCRWTAAASPPRTSTTSTAASSTATTA